MKSVCAAILNYNGIPHLEILLPSAIQAAKRLERCAVVVLDNSPGRADREWIAANFSRDEVETVTAPGNDYLFSYNWFCAQRTEDVVVLLNNDLKLEGDFFTPLVAPFASPQVFAVSAQSVEWGGGASSFMRLRLAYDHGLLFLAPDADQAALGPTVLACGGHSAVDRRKFLELDGFDRTFFPGYCEDLDLSFRALCRGWQVLYEPRAVCWHRGSATFNAAGDDRARLLTLRALHWFAWRTFRGGFWPGRHALGLLRAWDLTRRGIDANRWPACKAASRDWWGERRAKARANAPRVSRELLEGVLSPALAAMLPAR